MKKGVLVATLLLGFAGTTFTQSATVDIPNGYKVVVVPSSASAPQTISATAAPQTVYVAPASASTPVYRAHPCARHVTSVGGGVVIEHQIDDHH